MEAQGGGVVVNVASIAALRYIGKAQVSIGRTTENTNLAGSDIIS